MSRFRDLVAAARLHLPAANLARWASIFFTLSVLTLLISVAVSQASLAAAAVCYAVHVWRDKPQVRFPPVKLPVALFCLWTVVSTFFAGNPAAGGFAIRKLVLFVILLLTVEVVISVKHLEFLFQVLFLEAALAGVLGTVQFIEQYRCVRALHPHQVYFYMTLTRIHGFMGHWMNFGGQQMLVFAALLAFSLLASRGALAAAGVRDSGLGVREGQAQSGFGKLTWWLVLGLVAVSIMLNFTRGVWLGCFGAIVYLVARWKPRALWVLPVLLGLGYLGAPSLVRQRVRLAFHPSADPALSIRLEMWGVALRMMREHPWVGVGPNNIEQVYELYLPPGQSPAVGYHSHLHNNFFQFAAERGLPCLAAWVWLMAALGWQSWRVRRRLRGGRWVADAALAAWLAFLMEGCFEFNFGTSPVLTVFLFVVSTPFAAERIERWEEERLTVKSRRSNGNSS